MTHLSATAQAWLEGGTKRPSRRALLAFFAEMERVAQQRLVIKELAARDQAAQAIRTDLEGRRLPKVQEPKPQPRGGT